MTAVPRSHLSGAAEVVIVNLFDGLKVDDALQLCLVFICPREGSGVSCGAADEGARRGQAKRVGQGSLEPCNHHAGTKG